MGIRIQKYIGYYLPNNKIKNLLIKNYDEVLENNYSINLDEVEKEWLKMKEQNDMMYNVELRMLINSKEKLNIRDIVNLIFNGDNEEGLLFTTPGLKKHHRHSNVIDYYENIHDPIFKINYIKKGIYPEEYYVCVKEPLFTKESLDDYLEYQNPNKKVPMIQKGDVLRYEDLYILFIEGEKVKDVEEKIKGWCYPKKNKEKYFHPYINPLIYIICKNSGILKEKISYIDFVKILEPAIITTWC